MADQEVGFDVLVRTPGAKDALDETASGLREVGSAAADSAEGLDKHNAALSDTAKSADAVERSQLKAKAAFEAERESADGLTVAQRALIAAGVSLEAITEAVNRSTMTATEVAKTDATVRREQAEALRAQIALGQQQADAISRQTQMILTHTQALEIDTQKERTMALAHAQAIEIDAQQTRAMALAHAEALEIENALNGKFVESRAIVVSHAQALAMDAAASGEATAASGVHGLQLGRINMELGTAIGRFAGINTAATRFTAMLGGAVAGYGIMIGISLAIVAVAKAYDLLTESTQKEQKAQEEATKALSDWYKTKQQGDAGALGTNVSDVAKKLEQDRKHLADLQKQLPTAPIAVGGGLTDDSAIYSKQAQAGSDKLKKEIADTAAMVAAGEKEVALKIQEGFVTSQGAEASNLASLIKANSANEAERARALAILKQDQALLVAYASPPPNADQDVKRRFESMRAELVSQIKALDDAELKEGKSLIPKAPPITHGTDPQIAALQKQSDAMRQQNEQDNIAYAEGQKALQLSGLEGEARKLATNEIDAEIDRMKLRYTAVGSSLTQGLAAIDQKEKDVRASIIQEQATKDQEAAMKLLNEQVVKVERIGQQNATTTGLGTVAMRESTAATQKLSDSLRNDLVQAFDALGRKGEITWTDLFSTATRLSAQFTRDYQRDIEAQTKARDDAVAHHDDKAAQAAQSQIDHLQTLSKVSAVANTGLSVIQSGYNIGASGDGNMAKSALGGAMSGAVQGAALGSIIPGIGTAIGAAAGGLLGAAASLFGAADAQKKAAEAQQKAQDQAKAGLLAYNAQAGTGTAVDAARAQNTAQADALYDSINAALPGLKNQVEREKELKQVRDDQVLIDAKLVAAAKAAGEAALSSAQARLLAAGGDQNGAARINQQVQQQQELNDAVAQFGDGSDQVLAITKAQAAEAKQLADAQAEATKRQIEDLNIRTAAASGASDKQIADMQFVAQQERELADLRKQTVDPAIIAAEEAALAAEKAKRDADWQQTNLQASQDYKVRELRAEGFGDEADALALQEAQQREYQAAVQQGLDDATLTALKLAEAAEAAKAAADAAYDAIERQVSEVKQQAGVFGYSDQETIDKEAQAYGFGGETRDQVAAQYVVNATSEEDITRNKEIAEYLTDLDNYTKSLATSTNSIAAATTNANTSQIQNDIGGLSQTTGSRMADYLASEVIYARKSADSLAALETFFTGGGSRFGGLNGLQPANTETFTGAMSVTVNIGDVTVNGSASPQFTAAQLVKLVQTELGRQLKLDRLALSPSRN